MKRIVIPIGLAATYVALNQMLTGQPGSDLLRSLVDVIQLLVKLLEAIGLLIMNIAHLWPEVFAILICLSLPLAALGLRTLSTLSKLAQWLNRL